MLTTHVRWIPLLLSLAPLTAFAGPKYAETTKPLSQDHAYLASATATDYWKLAPYYLPQHNSKACSVASTTMVLNALRTDRPLTSSDELFTSESLVKQNPAYAKAVGKTGKGMDLDSLAKNLQAALDKSLPKQFKATAYRFNGSDAPVEKKRLVTLLDQNEKSPRNFVIANFLQGELTGDPEGMIGHISPVGAYDAKSGRVLILDSDRQYYEPYWVSVDQFMKAMNTSDGESKKVRGLVFVTPVN